VSVDITDRDRRLIQALQQNSRASIQDLAEVATMSTSACWRRVKQLEDEKVILGYTTLVDADAMSLTFSAIVHITLARQDKGHVETFISAVSRRAEVLECFATTGDADYHLRVLCRDKDHYNDFLDHFLFNLPGVAHIRTNLILKVIKMTTEVPIAKV